MSKKSWRWLAVLGLVSVLAAVSCTGGDDAVEAPDEEEATSTSLPPECEGVQPPEDASAESSDESKSSTTTTLPADCLNAVFAGIVADEGSEELTELEQDQLLGFGQGICAYASALEADPDNAPTYDELVASTSGSWGVSEKAVEEVLGFASTLCPGKLDPILSLRDDVGTITVQMTVSGATPVKVSYTSPDGDSLQDDIESPWEHEVILDPSSDFRLTASSAEGEVSCSVSVKGERQVNETAGKSEEAECALSSAQLREAAR